MLQNPAKSSENATKSGEKPLQIAQFGDLPEKFSSDGHPTNGKTIIFFDEASQWPESYWKKLRKTLDEAIEAAKRY